MKLASMTYWREWMNNWFSSASVAGACALTSLYKKPTYTNRWTWTMRHDYRTAANKMHRPLCRFLCIQTFPGYNDVHWPTKTVDGIRNMWQYMCASLHYSDPQHAKIHRPQTRCLSQCPKHEPLSKRRTTKTPWAVGPTWLLQSPPWPQLLASIAAHSTHQSLHIVFVF